MHYSFYIKSPLLHFSLLSENMFYNFHIITEEPSQHVRSDSAFASQKLKFAGQSNNVRQAALIAVLLTS